MTTTDLNEARRQAAYDKLNKILPEIFGSTAPPSPGGDAVYVASRCVDWIAKNPAAFEFFDRERWANPTRYADVFEDIDTTTHGELEKVCSDADVFAFLFGMARAAWLLTAAAHN